MTVLQVADLRFGYAGDTLFESVTCSLSLGPLRWVDVMMAEWGTLSDEIVREMGERDAPQ